MKPRLNIKYSFHDFFISLFSLIKKINVIEDNTFYFNHNRTALRIALSALELPKESNVAIMVYNCHTVMNAVKLAGYNCIFIDITNDFLMDIDDLFRKSENIKAIIVTHLFGIVNDIEAMRKVCPNTPIIEDCAHAFLSERNGVLAGSKGDMSSFSMGLAKFPSIGDGGYLQINNKKYYVKVKEISEKLSTPFNYQEFKNISHNCLMSFLYRHLIYGLLTYPLFKKNKKCGNPFCSVKETFISKSSFGLYLYKKHTYNQILYTQKQNLNQVVNFTKRNIPEMYIPKAIMGNNTNGFMFVGLMKDRDMLIKKYEKKGIELGKHFSCSIEWAKFFGYKGDCINAESIVNKILTFPSYYKINF